MIGVNIKVFSLVLRHVFKIRQAKKMSARWPKVKVKLRNKNNPTNVKQIKESTHRQRRAGS